MRCLLLTLIAFLLTACAVRGPNWVSPEVYDASRERIVAAHQAHETYYQRLAESYQAGGGGYVRQNSITRLRAPEEYYTGVLVNNRNQVVTFAIRGQHSLMVDVQAGQAIEVELPSGDYEYSLFLPRQTHPYNHGEFFLDDQRGDFAFNGTPYDWNVTAH